MHTCLFNHVQLFETPWAVAHQAPLSMGFSKQECWSGLPFPTPGGWNLHDSCVSCISRWILLHFATWEAHIGSIHVLKILFAFLLINLSFITGGSQPHKFTLRGLSSLSFLLLCKWNNPFQLRDTSPRPQENG